MQHVHHSIDPCNELQQKLFFQCSKKYNFPHLYRVDISSAQFTSLTLSTLRGIISAFRVVYLFRVTSPFPSHFPSTSVSQYTTSGITTRPLPSILT
jgi:hypothetical protein